MTLTDQLKATLTPASLAEHASNGHWKPAPHLDLINRRLLDVASGQTRRLLISTPPRHGKSEMAKHLAAWWLGTRPDDNVIVASYNDDLAADFGRAVRNLLAEHGRSLFGIELATDSSAANRFAVKGRRGGLIAVGVGGSMTGRGGHLILLDDVVKSDVEALSEPVQRRHWNWWRSTVRTRLAPGGAIVAIGTRWSEDDLLGRLVASGHFDVLNLPALAEVDDPLGREPGQALWGEMYDQAYLETTKAELGEYWWSALYQGSPQPAEGLLFRRDTFRYYDQVGGQYRLDERLIPIDECRRFITVDTAISQRHTADYTVAAVWAITKDKDLLLLDRTRDRIPAPEQIKLIRRLHEEWLPEFIGVEDVAAGSTLIQHLRDDGLPIKALKADRDKVARASTAATYLEGGKVWWPKRARWLGEWEAELLVFDKGRHDDQVDCLAYAALQISNRRQRQSLAGWTIDPDLYKPGLSGSYSYDLPRGSPNVGP
jgi:predicted phage terminase large subunit-like protein